MTAALALTDGVPMAAARVVCVFVHGRGQSPEAMQDAVIRHLSAPDVAYLLPRGPGGSWYAARAIDRFTDVTRAELDRSLAMLEAVMGAVQEQAPGLAQGRAGLPVVLAGFSQGACLVLEHAFRQGPWHGALVALTGCRVGHAQDVRASADLADLPVYLTCGTDDPWIPLQAFSEAALCLGQARTRLRADVFPGRGHSVSSAEIAVLDGLLRDLGAGRRPSLEGAA